MLRLFFLCGVFAGRILNPAAASICSVLWCWARSIEAQPVIKAAAMAKVRKTFIEDNLTSQPRGASAKRGWRVYLDAVSLVVRKIG